MMIKETPEIRARINELYKKHGAPLLPQHVVVDAKDPSSPLHELFDWDVQSAAEKHWEATARQIIICVRTEIVKSDRPLSVRAYTHPATKEPGYHHISEVAANKDLAMNTLLSHFKRAADVLRSCYELAVSFDMEDEVQELIDQVTKTKEVLVIRSGASSMQGRSLPNASRRHSPLRTRTTRTAARGTQ
jgi:hypothetical protein